MYTYSFRMKFTERGEKMVSSVDVAKLAGVSQATVSRVLNNPEKVNAATVDKVNAAISELNYRPNAAARSLISRKSGIIAVICGPLSDSENAEFAGSVITRSQEMGFIAEMHIQDPLKPTAVFEALSRTQAEGIIVGPLIYNDKEQQFLQTAGMPYVLCGTSDNKADFASMDNYAAGMLAARLLNSKQHRVVGWLGGNLSDQRLQSRYAGFLDYMKQQQVEVVSANDYGMDRESILTAMMAKKMRPTALVGATDEIAAYAIDFLTDYGYSIPADIEVLGIGNARQSANNYLGLSSIGIEDEINISKMAADALFSLIEEGTEKKSLSFYADPVFYSRKTMKL